MEEIKEETYIPAEKSDHPIRRRVFLGMLACLAVIILGVVWFVADTLADAPPLDADDIAPDGYRTTVLDRNGEEMVTLMGEASNRVYVSLEEMSPWLPQAFVAIEDQRFYDHNGIDLRGIARAAWRNVTSGSLSEGASTITQQLIKNNVFAAGTTERTSLDRVRRKLQEQYLAIRLERQTSKEWILENYLNTINLGSGTWGVQTAAVRYFGKDAKDLTLAESAVLAGITKSPAGYDPLKHPKASRWRQEQVLAKMLELGMISQEEQDAALSEDVYGRLSETSTAPVTTDILSYFEDTLVYEVLEDLMKTLRCPEEEAWQLLYRGGLTIYSTQDSNLQAICEEQTSRLEGTEVQAAVVMTEPSTGAVLAIVGGRGEKTGSLTWNRTTSSVRQPGSTIKVLGEYAALLDQGTVTLATVYDDAPYTYSDGTAIRNASGSFGGRTTIRDAIIKSVNVVALKAYQDAGQDAVWEKLDAFGLEHLTEEDRVESLALGGTHGGVTVLEMTAAYGAIQNGGLWVEPHCYTQVLDREGNILLEKIPEERQALSTNTAALLTSAMEDVLTAGTGTLADFGGMHLAGKSGTSTSMRDLWFVGYSPYYACGIWGGYDDNRPQTSSAYVKKLWRSVMEQAHENLEDRQFNGGEGLIRQKICIKCGNLATDGLCSNTVQGDMTRWEWFIPGTESKEQCGCHVTVELCESSGQPAGRFCPRSQREIIGYLAEGTPGTADEVAVVPEDMGQTCEVHTHWWSWLFPERDPESEDPFASGEWRELWGLTP